MRQNIWKAFSPRLDEKASLIRPSKVEQIIEAVLMDDPNDNRVFAIPVIGPRTATAVARYVYDDSRFNEAFDVKHWVCMCGMAAQHPSKLLDRLFREQDYDNDMLENFQNGVKEKRYLLVLDGLTAKDLGFLLSDLLHGVKQGTKIIMTASGKAEFGNLNPLFKVDGAPFEVAINDVQQPPQAVWDMFTNSVKFGDEDKEKDEKLEIGKEICIKYAIFPRLLQLIGSYLSLKKWVQEWKDVKKILLTIFEDVPKTNVSKFKHMRYEELQPMLQQCEWYCSFFPEDHHFQKTDLIHLWTSQQDLQTVEEKPQELMGVRNDGTVASTYKKHDAVKKLLEEVVKPEFCSFDNIEKSENGDANTRHICFNVTAEVPLWLKNCKALHSLLFLPSKLHDSAKVSNLNEVLKCLTCLRALNLAAVTYENDVPPIGELKEFRYLKLGIMASICLSNSVTRLLNLQTLGLRNSGITSLPKEFWTLNNLRQLYTGGKLHDLPPNFGELNNLQTLDVFIVGKNNGLDALSTMTNLVGKLTIRIEKFDHKNDKDASILNSLNISNLSFVWYIKAWKTKGYDDQFGSLEPPPGLESIAIRRWMVKSFPRNLIFWSTIFDSLVSVHIEDCPNLNDLSDLSTLPHLKFLQLWDLRVLEYIDSKSDGSTRSKSSLERKHYFPSLKYVSLAQLPKFFGWTSPIPSENLTLRVSGCPKMQSMPAMRSLVTLVAHNITGTLLKHLLSTKVGPSPRTTLRELEIDSFIALDSTLSISMLINLNFLKIRRCPSVKKVVLECLSSLKQLEIHDCERLEDIAGAPDQRSSLETFEIKNCNRLALIYDVSETSWKCFRNLHSLKLVNILSLEPLKNGLCSLEKLEQLSIHSVYGLRVLPEWIGNLKQLRRLVIRNCYFLLTLPDSLGNLSTLKQLELQCCPKLKHLPQLVQLESDHYSLENLEEVSLYSVNEVTDLLEWIVKLKQLRQLSIRNCPSLTELPGSLGKLSSLQQLELHQCPNIEKFPDSVTQLNSLQQLKVQQCPKLSTKLKRNGEQRDLISKVRRIILD